MVFPLNLYKKIHRSEDEFNKYIIYISSPLNNENNACLLKVPVKDDEISDIPTEYILDDEDDE